ncbi:putative clock-controlled protein 6 protein [Neofusicoccum parvum UCRNP2]|uniref:Putative clock-controlled protein 6 protein n=1 Tax=Botryosphaeria parva (strain UCR-NP2) TaxID=1287680 RepID=R1EQP1_BOTPV|nr:putative clock-controlled protein 6 protein [Neofusicoccum parvum UCRNP2]
MRFSAVAAAAALATGVHASSNSTGDVYVTEVVTAYTTFCPVATEITQGGHTYTVSEATTLTITHCPGGCTITKPVVPPTTPTTPGSPQIPAVTSSHPSPIYPTGSNGTTNGTASITKPTLSTSVGSSGSASGASSTASATGSDFTGAANKAFAASGAGLAALVGFAAYVL